MPFYWVNSVFMMFYIVMTLVFFYFLKNKEDVSKLCSNGKVMNLFNFLW